MKAFNGRLLFLIFMVSFFAVVPACFKFFNLFRGKFAD